MYTHKHIHYTTGLLKLFLHLVCKYCCSRRDLNSTSAWILTLLRELVYETEQGTLLLTAFPPTLFLSLALLLERILHTMTQLEPWHLLVFYFSSFPIPITNNSRLILHRENNLNKEFLSFSTPPFQIYSYYCGKNRSKTLNKQTDNNRKKNPLKTNKQTKRNQQKHTSKYKQYSQNKYFNNWKKRPCDMI